MTKHTPGPWNFGGTPVSSHEEAMEICRENVEKTENIGTHFCEVYLDDGRRTALVGHGPNSIANARLIAASPDLLEALQEMTIEYRLLLQETMDPVHHKYIDDGGTMRLALAAIAKATQP